MARTVLISGAARGIGACTARHLASIGFTVFAGVRTAAAGEELRQSAPERIRPVILDVSDTASIDSAMRDVAAQIDPGAGLDAVINNAGIYHGCPLQFLEVSEIRQIVEVNLLGAMFLTRAALPLLRRARGRVLMHGSTMGVMTAPTISVYGATKAGMVALCESLRLELSPVGVAVVLIEPGPVKSDLTAEGATKLDKYLARIPPSDRPIFESLLRRVVELSDPTKHGLEPIEVARVMARALTCRRPRTRYRVGLAAKLAGIVHELPDRVIDGLQRKIFRIRA